MRPLQLLREWGEVDEAATESLVVRTRMVLRIIIIGNLLFAAADPWLNPDVILQLSAVKLIEIAVQLGGLLVLRGMPRPRRTVAVGLLCFAAGAGAGAVAGVITNDPSTTPLLCIAGALVTAAVVPWGARRPTRGRGDRGARRVHRRLSRRHPAVGGVSVGRARLDCRHLRLHRVRVQQATDGGSEGQARSAATPSRAGARAASRRALVGEVVQLVEGEARESNVPIELFLHPALPHVHADGVQIEQVVINLVRNALEAMHDSPAATSSLAIETRFADGADIEVVVRDSGPGLRNVDAAEIFEPFQTTKPGGLGMGLAISRSIIEAHDGRLWMTPNPTRGVTFSFTLPVMRAAIREASVAR